MNRLLSNDFNSIKEINRLRKETKRLLNKGMWNMYLKVTIETFSTLRFSAFKNLSPSKSWRAPTQTAIIEFWNYFYNLKVRRLGAKPCLVFLLF